MSLECSECERDLRGGHDLQCSRYRDPRDGVCEAARAYLIARANHEPGGISGALDKAWLDLRDAVFAWEHPDGI